MINTSTLESLLHKKATLSICLLACLIFSGLLSSVIGAESFWDLRNYHLYNPFAFLGDRFLTDISPAQQQSYHNPIADLPFYFLVQAFNDRPAVYSFFMGLPYGMCLFFLIHISLQLFVTKLQSNWLELVLCVAIGSMGAATLSLIGSTSNELPMVMFLLGSCSLIIYWINNSERITIPCWLFLFLVGILAGLPAGLKLSYGIYAVSIGAGLCYLCAIRVITLTSLFTAALGMFSGFLAVSGHWMLTLYELFANPVFPYFNDLFQSPWAEEIRYSDTRYIPKTISDFALYPYRLMSEGNSVTGGTDYRDPRLGLFFIVMPMLALIAAIRFFMAHLAANKEYQESWPKNLNNYQKSIGFLLVTFLIAYILWLKGFGIYRYAVFLEILSGPLIVATISALIKTKAERSAVLLVTFVAILISTNTRYFFRSDASPFLHINAPSIEKNSLVFIVGVDAMAYVIPFMEPTARFIGIENNIFAGQQKNKTIEKIGNIVSIQSAPIYAVFARKPTDMGQELASFELSITTNKCKSITSNIGPTLSLCEVHRT